MQHSSSAVLRNVVASFEVSTTATSLFHSSNKYGPSHRSFFLDDILVLEHQMELYVYVKNQDHLEILVQHGTNFSHCEMLGYFTCCLLKSDISLDCGWEG